MELAVTIVLVKILLVSRNENASRPDRICRNCRVGRASAQDVAHDFDVVPGLQ